jgi:hypothetical protein
LCNSCIATPKSVLAFQKKKGTVQYLPQSPISRIEVSSLMILTDILTPVKLNEHGAKEKRTSVIALYIDV